MNRDRLANAQRLTRSLARRPAPPTALRSQIPRRAGAVQAAVIAALARAERPLRAREVHAAAEELAATGLSWNTIKDCLHKNARRPTSPIERVRHGLYRHRQEREPAESVERLRQLGNRVRWLRGNAERDLVEQLPSHAGGAPPGEA